MADSAVDMTKSESETSGDDYEVIRREEDGLPYEVDTDETQLPKYIGQNVVNVKARRRNGICGEEDDVKNDLLSSVRIATDVVSEGWKISWNKIDINMRAVVSAILLTLFITPLVVNAIDFWTTRVRFDPEDHQNCKGKAVADRVIAEQLTLIGKLQKQLEDSVQFPKDTLLVHLDEARAKQVRRKTGYEYFFIIVDWRRDDQQKPRQHLHVAFKQSNSSVYVYDHGPTSGKYFAVGDRIVDVDGETFSSATDVRDRILLSRRTKDYFTCIIERPTSDQAKKNVAILLQPATSSFCILLTV